MIIQSANIQSSYSHSLSEVSTRTERFESSLLTPTSVPSAPTPTSTSDEVSLSNEPISSKQDQEQDEISQLDAKTSNLKNLVESFIGREITLATERIGQDTSPSQHDTEEAQSLTGNVGAFTYEVTERYVEQESARFSVSGEITLTSGESLIIDFSQFTQRSFTSENTVTIAVEQQVIDPLVININGAEVTLTQNRYAFDLNNDGSKENIAFATANSAFLALDKNNNGKVDNGSELFGALTGNGYAELAQYDTDGNHFIDSGDSVFNNLQLLRKNHDGTDSLTALSDSGIAAIYLNNTSTPFQLKDQNNELQALVRNSSLFIRQDGTTGSTQQIDLVV